MNVKFSQLILPVLALISTTQLASCSSVGKYVGSVVSGVAVEIVVRCIFDNCFAVAKEGNQQQGQSLKEAIYDYYGLINKRQYDQAWSYLSPNFQNKIKGYNAYCNWWDTIDSVTILDLKVVGQSGDYVDVDVDLKYLRTKKKDFRHTLRIYATWNQNHQKWTIHRSEILK